MSASALPWQLRSPLVLNYAIAVLSVIATVATSLGFEYLLGTGPQTSIYICLIMFVAWIGGTGPALLATALVILAFEYFFLPPAYSFAVSFKELPRLAFFTIAALFVVVLSAAQRRSADTSKRAETALRESQAKLVEAQRELQLTIDTIPALVATYRADGARSFINKPWLDYSGLARQDVMGGAEMILVHPDDAEAAENAWRASLASGEPLQLEVRVRRADGEYRWHSIRRVPRRNDKRDVVGWYSAGFDIEDKKIAEDAQRRSEAELTEAKHELQQMIDTIPVFIATYRPDGTRTFVNKSWQDYMGLTLEQAAGTTTFPHFHPDDATQSAWRASLATGEALTTEVRVRRADGEYRWHTSQRVPLRDEKRNIIRWYSVGVDIEEQKRAEAALRRSEAQLVKAQRELQLAIDTIPALVGVLEPDGSLSFVNQTYMSYTGLTQKEATAGKRSDFHPDDAEGISDAWRASLTGGTPFQMELRLRRADGVYRWHNLRRVPLRDGRGDIVKWYGVAFDIEDQRTAETALRESEAELAAAKRELQLTIDTLPAMIATYEPDGKRSFINHHWLDYAGLSLQLMESEAGKDFIHPDDVESMGNAWRASVANSEPFLVEARVRRADGQYRWHTILRVPRRDEKGDVIRWYGVGHDIEDQRQAESALRQSRAQLAETERELRVTLDTIPAMTWRAGPGGYIEQLNKRWFDYTGTAPEDVRGAWWQPCVHPDDLARLLDVGRKFVASGIPIDAEGRLRRFDGEYRWFLFRPAPQRDATGKVIGWYGVMTDIEDRKRAERALQRSETYLTEAQKLSLTGSIVWDIATDTHFWSDETYQIIGFDRSVKPSMDLILERVHPDDRAHLRHQTERAAQGARSYDYEQRLLMPDGRVKHVHVRARRVKYESGKEEVVGALMDITQAKKSQEALHAAQTALAHASRVATLGEISATIAHEVNQPLAAIVTNGQACLRFLRSKTPNLDEVRSGVEWIVKDSNRAADVIQRVRGLLKKEDTKKAPLDVNDTINEVATLLQRDLAAKNVSLQRDLAPALTPAFADRVQLQQVIINLVMNGTEAMQEVTGRPRLLVIQSRQDEAKQVVVAVRDSGVGISAEATDRVFDAFFSTKPSGLGMGLSICRSIIADHGGRLWSTDNGREPGATFQFALPAYQEGTAPSP